MNDAAELTFFAVRQFIVVPDRYYRIDLVDGQLKCVKIGSQFDANHAGSLGRGQMIDAPDRAAGPGHDPRSETADGGSGNYTGLHRALAVLVGIGISAVSVIFLILAAVAGWIVMPFAVGVAFGGVVILGALVTPTKSEQSKRRHDIELPLQQIESAQLQLPKRAGSVGRLHLHLKEAPAVKLTINSSEDLQIVRERLMPMFGRRGMVR